LTGAAPQGERSGGGSSTAVAAGFCEAVRLKKDSDLLGRARRRLTSPERQKALQILDEGMADGARAHELAVLLGVGLTTLQRWPRQFADASEGVDRHKGSHSHVAHRPSEGQRQQIVPILENRALHLGLERSFYQVFHAHGQNHYRGLARPPIRQGSTYLASVNCRQERSLQVLGKEWAYAMAIQNSQERDH
jgi:hypothetical protein